MNNLKNDLKKNSFLNIDLVLFCFFRISYFFRNFGTTKLRHVLYYFGTPEFWHFLKSGTPERLYAGRRRSARDVTASVFRRRGGTAKVSATNSGSMPTQKAIG